MDLIEAFWAESSPQQRRLFLDEAAGRTAGAVTFEFDIVDVTLDFDAGTAVVADVLGDGEPQSAPWSRSSTERLRSQTIPRSETGLPRCSVVRRGTKPGPTERCVLSTRGRADQWRENYSGTARDAQ